MARGPVRGPKEPAVGAIKPETEFTIPETGAKGPENE